MRATARRTVRRCEWCGRRNVPLEVWSESDGVWICSDLANCEKHWPDVWPEGTRGVPEDRIAGALTEATATACDDLELRRRAAEGDHEAVAEMARRNRVRVGCFGAKPSSKNGGSHGSTVPLIAVSRGAKRGLNGPIENRAVRVA